MSEVAMASAVVRAGEGRSDVHRARGAGPLRLMTPRAAGNAAWIVTSQPRRRPRRRRFWFQAISTAVLIGPRVTALAAERLAALARVPRDAPIIVAGSPLGDGALFRIAGVDIEAVVHAARDLLRAAWTQLGEDPWSRKW